jgi:branched-chain amino acid transport system ATP-binding protein
MMTAVPKNVVLELASLNKFFGGVHAVRDMTFTIKKGELAGLIGPNGAGKTTIFNLVTGVYEPDSGHINFLGEDITSLKTYEVIRKGIARTFQNLRLFPRSTALENIMVAMQQHHGYSFAEAFTHLGRWGKREREIHLNSMDILDRVGLVDRADQAAGTLPYGMQRRLEIARALALEPEFLLLDEPAAGMNPEEVFELNDLIVNIHTEFDLTILVIEHHMDLVMEICPHIICMNFGARIAEGDPDEIQEDPEVLKAYLGEEVDE